MTVPRVRADYDQLAKIAAAFDRDVSEASQMSRNLRQNLGTLEGGDWIGHGARAFYAEMRDQVLPSLARLIGALRAGQRATLQILGIMQQAEQDAAVVLRGQRAGGPSSGGLGSPGGSGGANSPNGAGQGASKSAPLILDRLSNAGRIVLRWMAKNFIKKGVIFPALPKLPKMLTEPLFKGFKGVAPIIDKALAKIGLKSGLDKIGDLTGKQLGRLLFKNAGKAIPIPVVDLVVDLAVNTGFNIFDNYDSSKGFYQSVLENDKFWGSMMKDTAFSLGSLGLKTGIVAAGTALGGAAGAPAGGVSAVPGGVAGFMASSAGAGAISSVTMLGLNIAYGDDVKAFMINTGVPGGVAGLFHSMREGVMGSPTPKPAPAL